MRRLPFGALAAAAGFAAAVSLTGPARSDLLPTLPVTLSLPTITVPTPPPPPPPAVPPPPALPPPPPLSVTPPTAPVVTAPAPTPTERLAAQSRARTRRTRSSRTTPPARRAAVIGVRLRESGRIELVVRRHCAVLGRRQQPGHAGLNRVRFAGRLHGRRLRPGTYTINVVVIRAGRRSQVGRIGVRVFSTRTQRTDPQACELASTAAPPPPPQLLAAGAPLAVRGKPEPPRTVLPPAHSSSFRPPRLPLPSFADRAGGAVRWGLYAVMAVAALALVFSLTEFARKQWPARG
jgi:hypothetical protein